MAPSIASDTTNWIQCGSEKDRFTALFPFKPVIGEFVGEIFPSDNTILYSVRPNFESHPNKAYLIKVLDLGDSYKRLESKKLARLFLEGSLNHYLKSNLCTLNDKIYITIKGCSGIEFTANDTNSNVIQVRMIISDKRLITAIVYNQPYHDSNETARKFLDSVTPCKP